MAVKVFFTVDVEIWCNGWRHLDAEFPDAFQRYVYGPTKHGKFGLSHTLRRLNDHGLRGVFFTEPLFSARFGKEPLAEVVGLIQNEGQEVQLHLHTEWADEVTPPLVSGLVAKRQFLHMFDRNEQASLIGTGRSLLEKAGADSINAFRAGSFGLDTNTWLALNDLGIPFDSSFNGAMSTQVNRIGSFEKMHQPRLIKGTWEYPMSIFVDSRGQHRHAQLGACSFRELEWLLWRAAEESWESVVILSHNFELMNQKKDREDPIVVRRFERLCRFLRNNDDTFQTQGFQDLKPASLERLPPLPHSGAVRTLGRIAEQAWRRIYG